MHARRCDEVYFTLCYISEESVRMAIAFIVCSDAPEQGMCVSQRRVRRNLENIELFMGYWPC